MKTFQLLTFFFILVCIFCFESSYSQSKAYIPDANFRTFLNNTYPTFMNGSGDSLIIDSAATLTTTFDCSWQEIDDLSGVEHFVNINQLFCYWNNLTTIPALTGNTSLLHLMCYNNQLTSLPDLSTNTGLEQIWANQNQLTSFPDLTNNTALEYISCLLNELSSFPSVSTNTSLTTLYLSWNELNSIPDLSNNSALTKFTCKSNKLDFSDARELRIADALSGLTTFDYDSQKAFGPVTEIELPIGATLTLSIANQDSALSYQWFKGNNAIPGATDTLYEVLNAQVAESGIYSCTSYGTALETPPMTWGAGMSNFTSNNFIIIIGPRAKAYIPGPNFRNYIGTQFPGFIIGDSLLTDSAALVGSLICSNRNIEDITGLEWFFNISTLHCYNNNLTTLPDLSAFTNLTRLHCYNNQLIAIPDLSASSNLQQLYCYNNKLTTLPNLASPNFTLQRLYCYNNQLTSLTDLSQQYVLQQLRCNDNLLTSLPSISSTGIEELTCYNNKLTSLPFLPSDLISLYCGNNQLTSFPTFMILFDLENFSCGANQLTSLPDLSPCTGLKTIFCSGNQLTSFPDLSANTALEMIFCENNKLDFSDARELRIANSIGTLTSFTYSPQNPFGTQKTIGLNEGQTLQLTIEKQDSALTYQWYKNNIIVAGATDTILEIVSVTPTDEGIYTCVSYGTALNNPPMSFAPGISSFTSETQTFYLTSSPKAFIPDTNFRNFLNATYPSLMDLSGDSLIISLAATITGTFDCSSQNIVDLTGMQYFTNITDLWAFDNELIFLPDLINLTNLSILYCGINELTSIPDLTGFTNLTDVSFNNNRLDFSDARELRMIDAIPTLANFYYNAQKPFGITDTFNLNGGDTLELNIAVQDSALSYQWFNGNISIAGATDTFLVIQNVGISDTGKYTCESYGDALLFPTPMTFSSGITSFVSEPFIVNITITPLGQLFIPDTNFRNFLNSSFSSYMVGTGDSLVLDSAATYSGTLDCDGLNIVDLTGIEYFTNVTQLNCSNNKLDFSDARELSMIDALSSLTSFIYTPQNPFGSADTFNLNEGDSVALSIAIQDSALNYQWFQGADPIVGATDTILIIPSLAIGDSGIYTCKSYGTALDFPPMIWGPGIGEFVSEPFHISVTPICSATSSNFNTSNCLTYTVPSGDETYTAMGNYTVYDTLSNSCGSDS
ncbi:MAG: leucine-rich repeat domain-containing protein, partial [Flavobacteriales bacterium]|nr:leucine-rich repeat domain-containing protein [Flavobacteriales bacterium]